MTPTIDTVTYRVLRAFGGSEGKRYESGEVVDASTWRDRNIKSLVEGRYLTPIYDENDMPHIVAEGLRVENQFMLERIEELESRIGALEGRLGSLEGQELDSESKPKRRGRGPNK